MVSGDAVRLFDRAARKFRILDVPVLAREISAALVAEGKLFLGTSGHGLLVRELETEKPAETAVATAGSSGR
jgi:hypothetical protein